MPDNKNHDGFHIDSFSKINEGNFAYYGHWWKVKMLFFNPNIIIDGIYNTTTYIYLKL